MSAIAFLRELLDAGLDLADALIAADKFERKSLEAVEARKAKDRNRKRIPRNSTESAENTERQEFPETLVRSARVVPSYLPSLPSEVQEEVGGGGGGCASARFPSPDDWPAGKATEHARLIVEATACGQLDPAKSSGLVTTTGRLVAWRRDGASWEHDVLPVIAALCAKQRGPVSTWKFFDQAIARSIADNRAALQIPEAGANRSTGPPDLTARIAAEHAEARRRVLAS